MVTTIGFTRICIACNKKKAALGGTFNSRQKVWRCAACSQKVKMIKWNKGAPPSIGWWPTKHYHQQFHATYRWWDGECWSWAAFAHEPAEKAAKWAAKKEAMHMDVEWTDRPKDWPERSKT